MSFSEKAPGFSRGEHVTETWFKDMHHQHQLWLEDPTKGVRAEFIGCNFAGLDFARGRLSRACFAYSNFANANLAEVLLDGADLSFTNFAGANLVGASAIAAILTGANFVNANLAKANFTGALMEPDSLNTREALLYKVRWFSGKS